MTNKDLVVNSDAEEKIALRILDLGSQYFNVKNHIYATATQIASAYVGSEANDYLKRLEDYEKDFINLNSVIEYFGTKFLDHAKTITAKKEQIRDINSRL